MGRRPGLEFLVPRAGQRYVAHGRIPDHFLQHGIFEALGQDAFDYRQCVPAEFLLCHVVDKLLQYRGAECLDLVFSQSWLDV